ncbi:MAG: alkaline shock response membrane anchor protein AmaP [Kiritimatiellae bacterium]|nr:alkaline shock response membrane anchor protein AmaP [Kiritimatiellia bacterium]
MKLIRLLLGCLTAAFALALGAALSALYLRTGSFHAIVEGLERAPLYAFLLGIYIIGTVLVWVLSLVLPSGGSPSITFDTDAGSVNILLDAIRDFLAKSGTTVPHVVNVRPVVRMKQGRLWVTLISRVRAARPVPEIARALQEQARATLREALGITMDADVRVTVREIQVSPEVGPALTAREEIQVRPPRFGVADETEDSHGNGSV